MIRITIATALFCTSIFALASELDAQSTSYDNRQEYVRSSSPTKSGGRVYNEAMAGRQMVRIARGPGKPNSEANSRSTDTGNSLGTRESAASQSDRERGSTGPGYDYPEPAESAEVTAYRQAANTAPQLNFPPTNRVAQCNCNGVPVPPQQLQFPTQPAVGYGYTGYQVPNAGFAAPTGFQPQGNFGTGYGGAATGYPLQSGIGVPQFNQTGGNWWTPFVTGSGYYTPLLNFRNMPQGTYLGQGIIGQPTAYVDGQPMRNLLRYVSP